MNKLVKILSILVVTGMSLIFITSCKDDEKDPINPGSGDFVINGKVITEKTINADNTLQAVVMTGDDEDTVNEEVVGESKVENKSFSIKLRAPQNLLPYSDFEDFPSDITVSNPNARLAVMALLRLNNAGTSPIGKDFLICTQSLPEVGEDLEDIDLMADIVLCVYASEAVKIKGDVEEEGDSFLYDLDLKKGWNMALMQNTSDDNDHEVSVFKTISSVPSGYDWYLFSDIFTAKWSEKGDQMIQSLSISKLF